MGRVWRSSTLQVAFSFAPGSLGKLLSPKTLPQTCADSLCSANSASILPRNDELSHLRLLMARGVGLDGSWRLEAWQVTDETFTPINAPEPRCALQQANHGGFVVGRFRSPNGVAIGVVPGPVAALFVGSSVECTADGVCLHTSRWLPQSTTDPQLEASHLVLGPIVERVQRVDQWTQDSFAIDGNFFARMLLTPITIACDVALGPGTVRLWQAITGELPPKPLPPEFWDAARERQRQRAGSRGQD